MTVIKESGEVITDAESVLENAYPKMIAEFKKIY